MNGISAIATLPPRQRVFIGLFGLVVLGCAVHYAFKAAQDASAVVRWRGLIQHLARGENVYNNPAIPGTFPNPPILALVLWPLTTLPPVANALVWFAIKVFLASLSAYWSVRLATGDEFPFSARAVLLLIVLVSRPLLSDLEHGNVNILILLFVTAGLWAYRTERDWLAGLSIALATAFKLTPALFIPYFAYKRQWRVVAWSFAGLLLLLAVLPASVLGFSRNLWLLRAWYGTMVRPYVFEGKVETFQVNQSLPAIWLRHVTDCPGVKLGDETVISLNWLSLDHQTAMWILWALIAALLIGLAILLRTPAADRRDWRLACEYALVFIAMLLVSERSWKHHFVTMVLPYAAIIAHLSRRTCGVLMARYLWCSLAAALLLMASTSTELGGLLLGDDGHKYAQGYGMFGASAVVAMLAVTVILISANPASVGREPHDGGAVGSGHDQGADAPRSPNPTRSSRTAVQGGDLEPAKA